MDELDRLREDMRTIGRIAREAQRGHRTRDVALADILRVASRRHVEESAPRSRIPGMDPFLERTYPRPER